jgi:hypothetical protein
MLSGRYVDGTVSTRMPTVHYTVVTVYGYGTKGWERKMSRSLMRNCDVVSEASVGASQFPDHINLSLSECCKMRFKQW